MTAPAPKMPPPSIRHGKLIQLPIRTVQRRRGGEWHEVIRIDQRVIIAGCCEIFKEEAKPLAAVEDEDGIGCLLCRAKRVRGK